MGLSDNRAIAQLKTIRNLDMRMTTLMLSLQNFNIRFEHVARVDISIAKTLSSAPPEGKFTRIWNLRLMYFFLDITRKELIVNVSKSINIVRKLKIR